MPSSSKQAYILKQPPQNYNFRLEDGNPLPLAVYVNCENGKEFVQCDLCHAYIRLGGQLDTHRNSAKCAKKVRSNKRAQEQALEEHRAQEALQELRGAASRFSATSTARSGPAAEESADSPATPTAGLTPRASRANLITSFDCEPQAEVDQPIDTLPPSSPPSHSFSLPDSEELDIKPVKEQEEDREEVHNTGACILLTCPGQKIRWTAGSVWDNYAYHIHLDDSTPWRLENFSDEYIIIRDRVHCSGFLETKEDEEREVCTACFKLRRSPVLEAFMDRASKPPKPRTPWKYLSYNQLKQVLLESRKKGRQLEAKVSRLTRTVNRLKKKVNDFQRMVIMLSQNRIGGVSRLLSSALKNGSSPEIICDRLQQAISALPTPSNTLHRTWTDREFDILFLAKALAGERFLRVLQMAERYPSATTLRRYKPIPEIKISTGIPSPSDFSANIKSFLGETGRRPPTNPKIGQVAMIDGVALEEIIRLDLASNCLVGLCREHSSDIKKTVDTLDDIEAVARALNDKRCHRGKDATVLAIAIVTDKEDYHPVPLVLSPSCKLNETGEALAEWVDSFLETYHNDPNGEARHGPITTLATDGESSFRKLRFILGLRQKLDTTSELGQVLSQLPGLNLWTGRRGLLTTSDPKHIIKRFATMIRSPTNIQVGDTVITCHDCFETLTFMDAMTRKNAQDLLNPVDKQNVPKAVTLIESLFDISSKSKDQPALPSVKRRMSRIAFLSTVFTKFLYPFIKVEMSLSDQIRSLSTYAHLITALFQQHHTGFLTSALLADSQAVVKNIIFTVARLQLLDPDICYFPILEGTDRLEGVFSNVRTQDHARNFDPLQLGQKISIGAEVNAIFLRHPDLDRGHVRRNLVSVRGVDHVNPKSWKGNPRVGDVNLLKEYMAGRYDANELMKKEFGKECDFDQLFANPNIDHLRPGGEYVGSRAADYQEQDDDDVVLAEGLPRNAEGQLVDNDSDQDARELIEIDEEQDDPPESDMLNPSAQPINSHYMVVDGKKQHKAQIISSLLNGEGSARKVLSRPARAAGVTIESSLRKLQNLNFSDDITDSDNKIKAGDLGAILTRTGRDVCLAVIEVLSFKKSSSKQILASVDVDDLEAGNGDDLTIAGQVLELAPRQNQWIWQGTYIRIYENRKDDVAVMQRHYTIHVPGKIFFPLSPEIIYDEREMPVWSLNHTHLEEILDEAWSSLDPDTEDILYKIESLPKISGHGIPYKNTDLTSGLLWFPNPTLPLASLNRNWIGPAVDPDTLTAGSVVTCQLCGSEKKLGTMRNHVGEHILRARYACADKLLDGVEVSPPQEGQ
ncbi:hypothetical protein CVT26_010742 [Gymnopilus dilepis]|uniref:Uncharacterized protein n=1 Tax=Gymnopilus dilepis TaxID=231916 RepID=A0A409Y0T0_9AGAR|nr:hypothetical protein CVT26_010742 [Gymnopilus dilepis]